MFKFNNKDSRNASGLFLYPLKTSILSYPDVFRKYKQRPDVVLMPFLTFNIFHTPCSGVSIADFKSANAGWVVILKLWFWLPAVSRWTKNRNIECDDIHCFHDRYLWSYHTVFLLFLPQLLCQYYIYFVIRNFASKRFDQKSGNWPNWILDFD